MVILGAGGVGLLWGQLLGGGPRGVLIQTEIEPFRRDKAAALGADVVIDPNAEDLGDRVLLLYLEESDFVEASLV